MLLQISRLSLCEREREGERAPMDLIVKLIFSHLILIWLYVRPSVTHLPFFLQIDQAATYLFQSHRFSVFRRL